MNTNTTNATVTREALKNGKFRFRVNGEVTLKGSTRGYDWASLYQTPEGKVVAWFHARQDLAVKGNSDANKINDLKRVGLTEITEYAPETAATEETTVEELEDALNTNPWNEEPMSDTEAAEAAAELVAHVDAKAELAKEKKEKKEAPKAPRAPRRPEVREAAEGMKVSKAKNYTVKEVAELLAASPISVNRWVQMGKLTAVKSDPKEGRVVNLIPGTSVAEFLKGRADRAKAADKKAADKKAAAEKAKADRAAKGKADAKADKKA